MSHPIPPTVIRYRKPKPVRYKADYTVFLAKGLLSKILISIFICMTYGGQRPHKRFPCTLQAPHYIYFSIHEWKKAEKCY